MGSSELQSAANRWRAIGQAYTTRGLPNGLWQPLAKQDLQNVLQGHSAMDTGEIGDQLAAAYHGHAIVSQNQDQPSSNPFDIAGNFFGDVGSIAWNFAPAVAKSVWGAAGIPGIGNGGEDTRDLVRLAQNDPETQAKYGMEPGGEGGLGGVLRNMSRVPVFAQLIPGLHTAAAATTPEGRSELAAHPGFTLLDVMPVVSEVGRAGLLGRGAEAGTALESLQAGNPYKAAGRGIMGAAAHIPGVPERAAIFQTLHNAGMSSDIVNNVLRPLNVAQRTAEHTVIKFTNTDLIQNLERFSRDDPQGFANFNDVLKSGHPDQIAALPPEQQVLVDKVTQLNDYYRRAGNESGGTVDVMTPAGTWETYSADSEVAKLDRRLTKQREIMNKRDTKLGAALDDVAARANKLESNIGRLRRFGESDAAMAERYQFHPEEPINLDTVHAAMRPLIESFELDPRRIYQGIDQLGSSQARTAIGKDIHLLEGHDGWFSQLSDAMTRGDVRASTKLMSAIHRVFRHPVWDQTQYASTFRDYMAEMRSEMTGLRNKARAHGFATRTFNAANERLATAEAKLSQARELHKATHGRLQEQYLKSPPQRFHPLIEQKLRSEVATRLSQSSQVNTNQTGALIHGLTMDKALQEIETSPLETQLAKYVGKEEYAAIRQDSVAFWQEFARQGYNPRWIHNVDSATVEALTHPKIVPGEFHKPTQFRDAVFNLGRTMNNVAVALTGTEAELAREVGQRAFIDDHLMPMVTTVDKELPQYIEATRNTRPELIGENLVGRARQAMQKDLVPFDPARYGWGRYIKVTRESEMLIPKGVAKALDNMAGRGLPFSGKQLPGMSLYKMATLTGPRHMAHIAFGGLTFMAVREPGAIRFIGAAHRLLKDGEFYPEIQQSLHNLHDDGLFHYAAGKSVGRLLTKIPNAANRLEQMISDSYKVAVMLKGEASGLTHEQALALSNKVLIDMDNMTAFERNVAKTVFPFYGFTKHILRYAFTMAVDHPLRTAILSNLSRIEQKDRGDALPGTFNMLFFLGSPDSNGNVTGIDMKSVNPFRSMYNTFTLAGVLSSLNPYLSAAMEASGLNVLSATPELYPDLQVDPQTGQLVAVHKPSEVGYTIANAFVPEFGAVDAALGLSQRMKGLKESNPEAFHRALWSSLNMPFSMSDYNIPYEIQRLERKRYKSAQADVSTALQSGDFETLSRYNVVPVPSLLRPYLGGSTYTRPAVLAQLWSQISALVPAGVNAKAVLPRH